MMAQLYEYLPSFERTITRKEWKQIWGWIRKTKKELAEAETYRVELLRQDIPQHLKSHIIDELTYPPLIIHPRQKL
jgi:hypothetical protein